MTTEEKAKAYADNLPVAAATWGMRKSVIADAFIAGATEALASQWVSVEDRLPESYEEVLTYTVGAIDTNTVAYHDFEDWYTTDGEHIRPHYWLPIPPLKGGEE